MRSLLVRFLTFWLSLALLGIAFGQVATETQPNSNPKNLLLLYSYGHGGKGIRVFDDSLIDTLSANGIATNNLYFEFLDLERNKGNPTYRQSLREELQRKYSERQIDSILTVQQPAMEFLLNEGKGIAPDAPVITVQAPLPNTVNAGTRHVASLVTKFDIKGTLVRALELFPDTRRVVFVSGSSEADRKVAAGAASIAEGWSGKLEFEYTFDISLASMLKRVANLPPNSIILFTQYNRDTTGIVTVAYEVEGKVVKAANAPVFGLYDFNLINGGIGGSVVSVKELGRKTAQTLLNLWHSTLILSAPVTQIDIPVIPMFDWGQIQRWGGDSSRLGADSVFVNREPTFWENYRNYVLLATAFVVAQTLLIATLLVNRRRRRAAELLTKASEEKLAITLNSIGDAVIATDTNGRITNMNPAAERLCGWTLTEALGLALPEVFRIVNANTRETVADPVQAVMARGEMVGLANHTVLLAKSGAQYQIADSAAPIRNAAGGIVGVVLVFSDVTEKYRANEALHLTRFSVEAASDSLFWITPDAHIVDVNAAACRALEYTREELLQLSVPDVDVHHNAELWPQHFAELRERGSLTFESEQRTKDGRLFPVEVVANYVKHGNEERNCAFVRDITKRKQAEEEQKSLSQRLLLATSSAALGVWDWNVRNNTMAWDDRMFELYGITREASPNNIDSWTNGLHPEDKERAVAECQAALSGEKEFDSVFRVLHPNGKVLYLKANAMVMRDADGTAIRMLGINADITQRKLAEAKLQLAASVFGHAREGITITDAHGTIIDINETFTRITGYSREDAIGQNPRILKSGRQDKTFYEAMWNSLIEQGHWAGEIWNRRKSGEVFAELLTISAVRDEQGKTQQYVALFSDITSIKEHQRQLEHIAHFDALTSLPNRLLLADRLQQAMAQAQRRGQQLAVAYLDLDGFKNVNDHHGHDVGDKLLIHLASAMKDSLREGDTLARLGGDEFVAVLIDLEGIESCVPMLTRLLGAASSPVQMGEIMLTGSASIGVTFYPQANDMEADQLLRQADQAMYQAKLAGKNRYHVFDSAHDSSLRMHHESLERIRTALENREFVLHYQPKVNMQSGKVIGAEALIRWQHPEKGILAPATFLPVIEDHPLAVEVGEWVIDTALTQIEVWHSVGLDLAVSVNVGAHQLQQGDFVHRLLAILAKHPQVNPTSLELEVLETSALADMEQVSQVIETCHQMGVKFALDDFGTGYSSLTYLKRLRVAVLKIDQSFVRDMLDDPDDLAILEGVIGLAAAFKREVIAEGVETVEHGTALLHLGCQLAQGYGIARPMPPDQLRAWVASWQPDDAWSELPWLGGNPQSREE